MCFLVTLARVGANGSPAERKAELVVAPGVKISASLHRDTAQ